VPKRGGTPWAAREPAPSDRYIAFRLYGRLRRMAHYMTIDPLVIYDCAFAVLQYLLDLQELLFGYT
ncbi:MAG: hypothetical protein ABFD46_05895, partial [Armatimonadota bacterium]